MNRKIITVQELIDKLNKIEDKTRPVFIHPICRIDLNVAPLVVE